MKIVGILREQFALSIGGKNSALEIGKRSPTAHPAVIFINRRFYTCCCLAVSSCHDGKVIPN